MYSLNVLLSQFGTSLLFHVQFLGMHTDFSGGRSGGLVFPSLEESSTVFLWSTLKGFGVVNKAEVDVFLELSFFFNNPVDVGNLMSGYSAFSKSSLNIWKFTVHVMLKPGLQHFENYFSSMWDEGNCTVVWTFFGMPFFGIGMKIDYF